MKILIRLLAFTILTFTGLSLTAQEYGLASYYSDKFQGKPTASGELYDKDKLTAAHKTLPFGSIIEVTRLDNKKSVRVRVNDRGPYISGRVVDISRKAAERIGLVSDGVARVKVDVVEKANEEASSSAPTTTPPTSTPPVVSSTPEKETPKTSTKPATTTTPPKTSTAKVEAKKETKKEKPSPTNTTSTAPDRAAATSANEGNLITPETYSTYGLYKIELRQPAKQGFGVQVASLTNYENVLKQVADLQGGWFKNILLSVEKGSDGKPLYKIILGPFEDRGAAENYKDNLRKKNKIKGFVVNLEDLNY